MTALPDLAVFDRAWHAHRPALRRLAATLFDDPRLHPAPAPDDLLRDARPAAACPGRITGRRTDPCRSVTTSARR